MKRWSSCLAGLLAAVCLTAAAQGPAGTAEPLKEIQVAPEAFVRGAPVPAWADLLPLPPQDPALPAAALVVRLADSHLRVSPAKAYLVNRAEQAREASALGAVGQPQLQFNPQHQRLLLHRVHIVRGSETIDHTLTARVRFLQRETGLEQGIYSGVITAALLLEDVRTGDTLHLVYTVEGDNPIFGGRYADAASWEQAAPTQVRRVTLDAPADRPIRWRWVGGIGPAPADPGRATLADGQQRLRFEQRLLAAVDAEPYVPARAYPARWLQFSEYRDWAEVVDWARPLFPADAPLPPELGPVITRLRALPSAAEQASQALQWVQGEIRYWSVALGESSHRPALPAEVVQRRYGDCKDKTLLLVQMLRALGLQAEPALVSLATRSGPEAGLPSPLAFDHAVVRLRLDGQTLLLDPTRIGQSGAPERMGQHLENATVLPVLAGASALERVRSPLREQIFVNELTERFRLPAFAGDATLEAEQWWTGLQAEALRAALPTLDADKRRQWALSSYERRYPGIQVLAEPEVRDEPALNRIVTVMRFTVPQLARETPEAWVMRYFPGNLQGSFALPEQVSGRRQPLVLPSWPMTLRYTLEVEWPTQVAAVTDPSVQRVDTPHFKAEVQRSFRGNRLRASVMLQPLVDELPAAELPRLLEDLERFNRAVGSFAGVGKADLKREGVLGIGRTTLQDQMQQRLKTTLERTTRVIDAGKLAGEDLAGVLCTRAETRADLGEPEAGLVDAQQANKVAPDFGGALACRGSIHWALGEFAKASADYTAALAFDTDGADLLARRGRARFFEGRFEQAAADLAKAAPMQDDAGARLYVQLWQAIALRRAGLPLPADLAAQAGADPDGEWPRPALALLAGQRSPEQVLQALDARLKGDERELALAEAWFYIGEHHLAQGRQVEARQAFEAVRRQGITMYIEHVAAGHELKRLAP